MHSAPSVTYPVLRSARAHVLVLAFWALGAVSCAAWCYQADHFGVRQMAALAALLLTASLIWWDRAHARQGNLHWDGQYWSLDGNRPVRTARASVHLDFQSLLLLRLQVDQSVSWLWLDRQASPAHWIDVRRALFAAPARTDKMTDEPSLPRSRQPVTAAP